MRKIPLRDVPIGSTIMYRLDGKQYIVLSNYQLKKTDDGQIYTQCATREVYVTE